MERCRHLSTLTLSGGGRECPKGEVRFSALPLSFYGMAFLLSGRTIDNDIRSVNTPLLLNDCFRCRNIRFIVRDGSVSIRALEFSVLPR